MQDCCSISLNFENDKATEEKVYLDDVVGGGVDGALVHRLRDKEEVIPKQYVVNINQTDRTEETSQARSHHCPPQFHLEGWRASHSSWS